MKRQAKIKVNLNTAQDLINKKKDKIEELKKEIKKLKKDFIDYQTTAGGDLYGY